MGGGEGEVKCSDLTQSRFFYLRFRGSGREMFGRGTLMTQRESSKLIFHLVQLLGGGEVEVKISYLKYIVSSKGTLHLTECGLS